MYKENLSEDEVKTMNEDKALVTRGQYCMRIALSLLMCTINAYGLYLVSRYSRLLQVRLLYEQQSMKQCNCKHSTKLVWV